MFDNHPIVRSLGSVTGVLLLVGALGACGDDDSGDQAEPVGPPVSVLAVDNTFQPDEQVVSAGTLVVWENRGRNEHDIVPEDPDASWAVGPEDFQPGDQAEFRFSEPGTFRYYCSIHGNIDIGMPGVIIVE